MRRPDLKLKPISIIIALILMVIVFRVQNAEGSAGEAMFITGTTLMLCHNDEKIQQWFQNHRTEDSDDIAKYASYYGDARYTVPLLGAVYLYGNSRGNDKITRTALYSLESVAISDAVVGTLKFATHRHRPNSGSSCSTWDGASLSRDNLSFPSAHAASAFAVSTVFASEYKGKPLAIWSAYGLAVFTSLSRLNDNEHWASDVFVGAAVGYYTAKSVIRLRQHDTGEPPGHQALVSLSRHF